MSFLTLVDTSVPWPAKRRARLDVGAELAMRRCAFDLAECFFCHSIFSFSDFRKYSRVSVDQILPATKIENDSGNTCFVAASVIGAVGA